MHDNICSRLDFSRYRRWSGAKPNISSHQSIQNEMGKRLASHEYFRTSYEMSDISLSSCTGIPIWAICWSILEHTAMHESRMSRGWSIEFRSLGVVMLRQNLKVGGHSYDMK
jgi:hypothetical protein